MLDTNDTDFTESFDVGPWLVKMSTYSSSVQSQIMMCGALSLAPVPQAWFCAG